MGGRQYCALSHLHTTKPNPGYPVAQRPHVLGPSVMLKETSHNRASEPKDLILDVLWMSTMIRVVLEEVLFCCVSTLSPQHPHLLPTHELSGRSI